MAYRVADSRYFANIHALPSLDMFSPSMRVLDLEAWSFQLRLPSHVQDVLILFPRFAFAFHPT